MEFCVSSRQQTAILKQTNEIMIATRDYQQVFELIDQYPTARLILRIDAEHSDTWDTKNEKFWNELKTNAKLAQGRLILAFNFYDQKAIDLFKEYVSLFYINIPVRTFSMIKSLKQIGVCYILIDAPLTHMLKDVMKAGIPIRMIPNLSYLDNLPHENGIHGNWVRPEDTDVYGEYVSIFEFGKQKLDRERALFDLYANKKAWPGDLGMIIQDLNATGVNRLIRSNESSHRVNCGQSCERFGTCQVCDRLLALADEDLIQSIKDAQTKNT